MKISFERLPDCKARLSAEFDSEKVKAERNQIIGLYAAQARVAGYRPGKTPTAVIEKRYGDAILEELKDRLTRMALFDANKTGLKVLGISTVEREQFEADDSFLLALEVVTEPDVGLEDYKEIPVEVLKVEINDEMVDGYIKNIMKQRAVPTEVDRAAAPGDLVVVDYTATLDGESLKEKLEEQAGLLAQGEGHWLDLPEEGDEPRDFIPGISEQALGMSAGESKQFDAEFPEEFPIEVVAGKTVSYDLKVTQVKEREVAELDDEYAKTMGIESVEQLKAEIHVQFEQQQERHRNEQIDNQILAHLNEEMTFDLPEHIVMNETQRQVNEMVSRGYEQGMTQGDIEENQEELVKSAEERAKNDVKTMFIINEIAKKEGITVTDSELNRRVVMMAMQQGRPPKKLARELKQNNALGEVQQSIRVGKTIQFLRESAVVTEVDPPKEDA